MRIKGGVVVAGLLAVACTGVTAPPGLPRPATPVTHPAERIRLEEPARRLGSWCGAASGLAAVGEAITASETAQWVEAGRGGAAG